MLLTAAAVRHRGAVVNAEPSSPAGLCVEWAGYDLLPLIGDSKRLCVAQDSDVSGGSRFVLRWKPGAARQKDPFVIWIARHPRPRSRTAFWLRVITRLHSHGIISDTVLTRAINASGDRPWESMLTLRRTLQASRLDIAIVVDGVRSCPEDDEIWQTICNDILDLVTTTGSMRFIVATSAPTVLEAAIAFGAVPGRVIDASGPRVAEPFATDGLAGAATLPRPGPRPVVTIPAAPARSTVQPLPDGFGVPVLSRREEEVLRALFITGKRSELASILYVSENTVKSHLRSLYQKLDAHTRAEALARASARGLVPLAQPPRPPVDLHGSGPLSPPRLSLPRRPPEASPGLRPPEASRGLRPPEASPGLRH